MKEKEFTLTIVQNGFILERDRNNYVFTSLETLSEYLKVQVEAQAPASKKSSAFEEEDDE